MAKETWKPGNMLYPVPAVMVSCQRPTEKPNIITVAWAGTVCTNPPMLSISVRPERYSNGIIAETGEFVVNLVTKDLVCATDYCGVKSGRDVDKFDAMHLGSHDMFLADVVGVTVDDSYMNEKGKFELNQSGLVTYSHGEYFLLGKKLGSFGYSVKKQKPSKNGRKKKAK